MKPHFFLTVFLTAACLLCAAQSKALKERLTPSITFQYHALLVEMLDVNPSVWYRFNNGRVVIGAGWNYRLVNNNIPGPVKWFRCYGPRTFVELNAGFGFSIHADTEYQKLFLPEFQERKSKSWVNTSMLGVRKSVALFENVNVFGLVLYRIDGGVYPYEHDLNFRFGLEYAGK